MRDLTSLNQGRFSHACGSYVNGGKKVYTYIVAIYDLRNANFQFLIQLPVHYGQWRND